MRSGRLTRCFALFFALLIPALSRADRITAPEQFFGHPVGADFQLIGYRGLVDYWTKLDHESRRLSLAEIGKTEEGRTMVMAIITSPRNQSRLAEYRRTARSLALAKDPDAENARKLAEKGRAVVWIDGGLHSSETLGSQQLIEMAYQLASRVDSETRRILDDVIVLLVPANPDGIDLVADWYNREPVAERRRLGNLPRLYQKYIGHDNNRDFYAVTQSESKAMNRVMYREWFPQIMYNHHQTGPPGTVMFAPPFRDPFNYRIDPLVMSSIDALGAAMMNRFLTEGKTGVTRRSGANYSAWWNGGLRTTAYFHNIIGLLTETIGSPNPMRIPFVSRRQLPSSDLLAPVLPGEWRFRQSVDYSVTANYAVLDYASRHRTELLLNIWRMGRRQIEMGSRDSWTVTPKHLASLERVSGEEAVSRLRDPVARDPRCYILPSNQPDFLTAVKFANMLIEAGIEVKRAKERFVAGGKPIPAGSLLISCAQAFRPHILDMFEPQDHPDDIPYAGAPPIPPYDAAGYTLAYQMGVRFERLFDEAEGTFEEISEPMPPPAATVLIRQGAAGFFLHRRTNDSFRAVNRLLAAGEEVWRINQTFLAEGVAHPPGLYVIKPRPGTLERLRAIAKDLGTRFIGTPFLPEKEAGRLRPPRIGLWDLYGGSMTSGWTRWILEQFEFPYKRVFAKRLDAGDLRSEFDVLLFPSGAIPSVSGPPASGERDREPGGEGGKEIASDPATQQEVPEEFRDWLGRITAQKTIPKLREFLEAGGTIVAIGTSTQLAAHLGLPIANYLAETGTEGRAIPLPKERFYVPASVLEVAVTPEHPLSLGLASRLDVMFQNSPVFRLLPGAETMVTPVAWFDTDRPLRSGWAWGQERLRGGVAIADAAVGKGRLVLIGPEVLYRGQSHGAFRIVFNALFRAGQDLGEGAG